jgi:hypothetical protein
MNFMQSSFEVHWDEEGERGLQFFIRSAQFGFCVKVIRDPAYISAVGYILRL